MPALKVPPFDEAAVRETIQQRRGPLFIITPAETRLDALATAVLRAAPEDAARLGFAVAHLLDGRAPEVPELPMNTARAGRADRPCAAGSKTPAGHCRSQPGE